MPFQSIIHVGYVTPTHYQTLGMVLYTPKEKKKPEGKKTCQLRIEFMMLMKDIQEQIRRETDRIKKHTYQFVFKYQQRHPVNRFNQRHPVNDSESHTTIPNLSKPYPLPSQTYLLPSYVMNLERVLRNQCEQIFNSFLLIC